MVHGNASRRHGTLKLLSLAAALGLAAIGLSQCRAVSDTVTGLDLSSASAMKHGRNDCVRVCNDAFKTARAGELARHRQAVRDCGRDSACRKAEQRTHVRNMAEISRAMQLCKRNCYNEGAGSGGR